MISGQRFGKGELTYIYIINIYIYKLYYILYIIYYILYIIYDIYILYIIYHISKSNDFIMSYASKHASRVGSEI